MIDHLVIGDPHAVPGVSNDRFTWLGNYIIKNMPQVIVCMGDFGDMESLCSYDKGKKDFHGRSFKKDVASIIDAQNKMFAPMRRYNKRRAINKKQQYKPKLYMLGGNHDEGRIDRVVSMQSELEDLVTLDALQYKEQGWHYVPYKECIEIDGIFYSHYFPSGVMDQPISGPFLARRLLQINHHSSTVGHNHTLNYYEDVDAAGRKIQGLCAGCYFEHNPAYAGPAQKFWWRGLVHKRNVVKGVYDPDFIRLDTIKELYS